MWLIAACVGVLCGSVVLVEYFRRTYRRRDDADYIPLTPERLSMFVKHDQDAQARGAWL
jgi:hypothetical protein